MESEAPACPICLDPCTDRQRTLDCGHIFCEACICKYAEGLRNHQHSPSRLMFPCPCCREEVPIWQQRKLTEEAITSEQVELTEAECAAQPTAAAVMVQSHEAARSAAAQSILRRVYRPAQMPWWSQRVGQSEQERRELARASGRLPLRFCPGCSTPIIKNGGCNSMRCPCGRRFKWMEAQPVRPCRHCHKEGDANWLNPGRWTTCAFCAPRARREAKALKAATVAAAMPVAALIGAGVLTGLSAWVALGSAVALVPAAVFGPPALAYEPVRRACGFERNYLGQVAVSGAGLVVVGTAVCLSGYDSDGAFD